MKPHELDDYLEILPQGLASHQSCVVKASVLRDALGADGLVGVDNLPKELAELTEAPPPVSSFIAEVWFNATMLAILDQRFDGNRRAFVRWVFERNLVLLRKPLYRVLFVVMSPDRLLGGMERRWTAFRRGSTLTLVEKRRSTALFELRFPTHLHVESTLSGLMGALRAAAVAAGATDAQATLLESSERVARFEVKWV